MLESLIARARFYDFTGYWIPGNLTIGIIWIYARVFGWAAEADKAISFVEKHWLASTILIFIVGGYAIGHLVNAISKFLIEKIAFAVAYKNSADWLGRLKKRNGSKEKVILKRFEEKFGYSPNSSVAAGPVIQGWAEQKLPAPSMTTFRFLCFYGMNRTLAVLTIAIIPPAAHWSLAHSHFCCMIIVILAGIIFAGMFIYQYLRFVEYYANSIPELLLMDVAENDKAKDGQRKGEGNE